MRTLKERVYSELTQMDLKDFYGYLTQIEMG